MIFDFTHAKTSQNWYPLNDTVMGGVSSSSVKYTEGDGMRFSGFVSTENNGGFCMIKSPGVNIDCEAKSHIVCYLKGDGKQYQIRIKSNPQQPYSYVLNFKTSGNWERLAFPLEKFEAQFRGRVLDMPNFNAPTITEVAILIGNKKNEKFQLDIKWMGIE
ncbi:CIA30 family protein [Luteibaculum oceani]|nr:CIA30 family protein [Luteibaculum oceani]